MSNNSVIALLERQQAAFNQQLADYYQHMRHQHQLEQHRLNSILYHPGSHTDSIAMETDCGSMSAAAVPQRWPLHQIQERNSQSECIPVQHCSQNTSKRQLTDDEDYAKTAKRPRN